MAPVHVRDNVHTHVVQYRGNLYIITYISYLITYYNIKSDTDPKVFSYGAAFHHVYSRSEVICAALKNVFSILLRKLSCS